ncbi:BTAD domain-containing putative transcriptional regulator [Kribbella sp. NBC_00359]|uniref:BTAD domain-containing putative transcriptional regulator n=1 Tax=Kribbella sp. NBC_00359 TaxID=2975966 RepID=UPI002E2504CE
MRFRVLGPVEVLDADGGLVQLGGQKQRALLGLLLASGGRVVSVSRIIDELWAEDPPEKVLVSVQSYVANLRRALEPDRAARSAAKLLVTQPPGYSLAAASVDAVEFEQLVTAAHDVLPTDPGRARELFGTAAELWRGEPYADLSAAVPGLAAEAVRLGELWLLATENRLRADFALGGHERLIGEIERLVELHPLRETAWGLLALAFYRSQRQGEALDALRRARRVLADELGADPGPELRRLEQAILDHDPSLEAAPLVPAGSIGGSVDGLRAPAAAGLVGRDGHLNGLTEHLVNASAGRGVAILVTGEPGIGKTALARALTATAAAMGLKTGWGRCDGAEGAPALWPFSQALAELLDHDSASAAALAALTPGNGGSGPTDADTAAFHLAEGVVALLRSAGPILLVLDDLHRADGDTLRLVQRLGATLSGLPVVLLLTSRDADADLTPELGSVLADLARAGLVRIGLHGLDEAEVRAFAKLHHDADIPVEVAGALMERTNGNPFFVGELIRLLAEQRRLTDPAAAGTLEVPDGVRDVVRQRISQLPAEVEPLLSAAAVSGVTFDGDLAEAVSGLPADDAVTATEAALLAGLIVADGNEYRFTHALVREAVYARVPLGRRRQLHGALAVLLEQRFGGARLAEIAHHHAQAGPDHARAAWTSAVRAAAVAARQPAPAEAARLQVLAHASVLRDSTATGTDRYDVLAGLARAQKRAGQERQAGEAARAAAETALDDGDALAAAKALVDIAADGVWSWREYQVVDSQGVALIERLLSEIPPGADVIRARLLAALAGEIYYDPDAGRRSVELSAEAERLVRGRTGDGQDELARVLELRHLAYERPQLLTERLAAAGELVDLAESADDPIALARALVFRGRDQMEQGDLAAGLRDYQRARVLARTHAHAPVLVALDWADAVIAIARGRFAEAEDVMAAANRFHALTTVAGGAEVPMAVTATLHLVRGSLPVIEPMLAGAAAATGLPLLHDWHALALVQAGRAEQARSELGPWQLQPDIPADYLCLTHLAIRAELWSRLASQDAAADLLHQLTPYADRLVIGGTGITVTGFAGHQVGLLARTCGDLDQAIEHLTTALDRHQQAGLRPFAAASARELAVTLRQRGRPDDHLRAASLGTP